MREEEGRGMEKEGKGKKGKGWERKRKRNPGPFTLTWGSKVGVVPMKTGLGCSGNLQVRAQNLLVLVNQE